MSKLMGSPAVDVFAGKSEGGVVTGYAAPRGGTLPSVLKLMSDDVPVAYVRASRFSAEAEDAGLRLGWCGFRAPGLSKAFAVGSRVTLRCAHDDRVLMTVPYSEDVFSAPGGRALTAESVILAGGRGESFDSPKQMLPFLRWHRDRHGHSQVIEAAFMTLLGRWPDGAAVHAWTPRVGDDKGLVSLVTTIVESDEFLRKPVASLPGPFHQGFRFDRGILR